MPIAPGTDTAPQAAHSPNILNLRRLSRRPPAGPPVAGRSMSTRFQGSSSAKYSVRRQFDVIVCAVGVTAAAIRGANAATDRTPSRLPPCSMPCPLSSRPARRRIHRRPPPQCRQAALRGSRAAASSRITIRNRARPERTAAIRRPRKRRRARRANSRQIPTRRPRPLPTTASLRRKTARRPTPRTRPIPIRLRNRTRQIRMRWRRPPIPAKSRHLAPADNSAKQSSSNKKSQDDAAATDTTTTTTTAADAANPAVQPVAVAIVVNNQPATPPPASGTPAAAESAT